MRDEGGGSSPATPRPHPTALRLALRSLTHRGGQTVMILLVSALVSAITVFAAGYQQLIYQVVVDQTFAESGPGTAWSLRSGPEVNQTGLLPDGWEGIVEPPVLGRTADVLWSSPAAKVEGSIRGSQRWRADMCAHVELVSGRCPVRAADVAVSTADVETFGLELGDRLTARSTLSPNAELTVSGIYRVDDPEEPYWFDISPVGKSLFQPDVIQSDDLLVVEESIERPSFQNTMDLRLDRSVIDVADLGRLATFNRQLVASTTGQGTLVSGVPANLERIERERRQAVTGLTLSLAQLAVVVGVVLALLAAVHLGGQRTEVGLARLRGERAAGVGRLITGRWALVVGVGWLVGLALGIGTLLVVAAVLPGELGRPEDPVLLVAPVVVLAVMVGIIVAPVRALLVQSVISLLRAAPSAVRDTSGRQLLADVVLLVLAVTGLVVALQVRTDSVLGLLIPSLLALGLGIVLFRIVVWLAAGQRRSLSRPGARAAGLLQAILTFRLRGLRLLVITTSVATAFAVFTVQLLAIGSAVRRHDAEVRTGAAAVVSVNGPPPTVLAALDRVEPQHRTTTATMTPVVLTRREDPRALRSMFVEPAAFTRIAIGADLAADEATWSRLQAASVEPVRFRGDTVAVRVGRHDVLSLDRPLLRGGSTATLGIAYVSADGIRHNEVLGQIGLRTGGGEALQRPVFCREGCTLLRIAVVPDGPMIGDLPLTSFAAVNDGAAQPIDLGPADRWPFVPGADLDDILALEPAGTGVVLRVRSEGGQLGMQHAWIPIDLPALVAPGSVLGEDPTLRSPSGGVVPIAVLAESRDAVPGLLDNVAVADLETMVRAGQHTDAAQTTVQVWVAEAALGRLPELERALTDAGLELVGTRTAEDAVAASRTTAPALTAVLAPALAALAAAFAALGIALTVSGQRSVLGRDLAAVRLAGAGSGTVRRAATLTYLWPTLAAVALGAVAGTIGCLLVVTELPMLADPQPAIHADLRLRVGTLLGSVALFAGILTAVVLLAVRWLDRSSVDQLGAPR